MFNFRQSQTICGFRLPTKEPEIFLNKLLNVNLIYELCVVVKSKHYIWIFLHTQNS